MAEGDWCQLQGYEPGTFAGGNAWTELGECDGSTGAEIDLFDAYAIEDPNGRSVNIDFSSQAGDVGVLTLAVQDEFLSFELVYNGQVAFQGDAEIPQGYVSIAAEHLNYEVNVNQELFAEMAESGFAGLYMEALARAYQVPEVEDMLAEGVVGYDWGMACKWGVGVVAGAVVGAGAAACCYGTAFAGCVICAGFVGAATAGLGGLGLLACDEWL